MSRLDADWAKDIGIVGIVKMAEKKVKSYDAVVAPGVIKVTWCMLDGVFSALLGKPKKLTGGC